MKHINIYITKMIFSKINADVKVALPYENENRDNYIYIVEKSAFLLKEKVPRQHHAKVWEIHGNTMVHSKTWCYYGRCTKK